MNDIKELREHLFDTLRGVKDGSFDIERAKAMNEVASVLIQTAKVEIDYVRATGAETNTGFLESGAKAALPMPPVNRGLAAQLKAMP